MFINPSFLPPTRQNVSYKKKLIDFPPLFSIPPRTHFVITKHRTLVKILIQQILVITESSFRRRGCKRHIPWKTTRKIVSKQQQTIKQKIINIFNNFRIVVTVTLLANYLGCYKMTLECKDKLIPFYKTLGYSLEAGNGNSMNVRFESPDDNKTTTIAINPS